MSTRSSKKQVTVIFPHAHSVTNLEDIEEAKSPIAWQIFEEFMSSAVNHHKQQITSMFDDYCRENPDAVECNIYP
ncbi:CP12 domain-containing protein [Hydrocoleum sp. CS-953]|uniref:CP12 domain-containing protein n=1 Tax=Microcoleaceae TaxID=1892252 RepID=UPI000B9A896F|nr:CP12 domain-containing protein [Hydrocoleum sp. CS-953]OZH52365.1 hypothetical protein AFK68_24805 [Hydrocoleum sp. CS-953]